MMLQSIFLKTLEKAINQYIDSDPSAFKRLSPLADKYIAIHLDAIDFNFIMGFQQTGIYLQTELMQEADVSISATPLNLLYFFTTEKSKIESEQTIKISGDIMLAQQMQDFFKSLHIDWGHYLSPLLGDAVTEQLGKVKKSAVEESKQIKETLSDNIREYFQEESDLFANRLAVEAWYDKVDHFRDDCERLSQRLDQLQNQSKESGK